MDERTVEFTLRELLDLESALLAKYTSTLDVLRIFEQSGDVANLVEIYTDDLARIEGLWYKLHIAKFGDNIEHTTLAQHVANYEASRA